MEALDRLGWAVHETYRVGEARIGVRTTSPAFGAWLRRALADRGARGASDPHFSVLVGEDRGGRRRYHVLYRAATEVVRTLHLPTLARALLAELDALLMPWREDAVYLDAALVRGASRTALIPATLAWELSRLGRRPERAGLRLPGETAVAVGLRSGLVSPVRRSVRAAAGSLRALPSGGSSDRSFVRRSASVDVVVVQTDEGGEVPAGVSAGGALHGLAGSAVNLHLLRRRALDPLARLVGGAERYAVGWGEASTTLEPLAALLASTDSAVPKIRASADAGAGPVPRLTSVVEARIG